MGLKVYRESSDSVDSLDRVAKCGSLCAKEDNVKSLV
jgi:hypothetical protein